MSRHQKQNPTCLENQIPLLSQLAWLVLHCILLPNRQRHVACGCREGVRFFCGLWEQGKLVSGKVTHRSSLTPGKPAAEHGFLKDHLPSSLGAGPCSLVLLGGYDGSCYSLSVHLFIQSQCWQRVLSWQPWKTKPFWQSAFGLQCLHCSNQLVCSETLSHDVNSVAVASERLYS